MGDIWAMGGQPTTALAIVVIPLMSEVMMEEEMYQLMAGAAKVRSQVMLG